MNSSGIRLERWLPESIGQCSLLSLIFTLPPSQPPNLA